MPWIPRLSSNHHIAQERCLFYISAHTRIWIPGPDPWHGLPKCIQRGEPRQACILVPKLAYLPRGENDLLQRRRANDSHSVEQALRVSGRVRCEARESALRNGGNVEAGRGADVKRLECRMRYDEVAHGVGTGGDVVQHEPAERGEAQAGEDGGKVRASIRVKGVSKLERAQRRAPSQKLPQACTIHDFMRVEAEAECQMGQLRRVQVLYLYMSI